ncbi:MAG: TonB family protein [Mariprofundaceae bacterium]|nr:TonB family protein [Mariprofundaceae bacterium]
MSLNRAAKGADDIAALRGLDFLIALLLHVLVIIIIAVLAFWHSQRHPAPLKRIEVSMISAKQLKKLQRAAMPRARRAKPKPVARPRPKPRKATAEESFDPFAPLVSESPKAAAAPRARTDMATVLGKQLSRQEIDRYIARIQAAVQEKWKVPASVDSDIKDPLVEMLLRPDGSVQQVRILESSGNDALDASLVRAIQAAAPFELPRRQFEVFRSNRIRFHPLR